jgi:CheY-like chemotaxis protein
MLAVSDTGEGIPTGILSKVFEPFFTTKGVGKGSGLGLSMVFGFARQSGGHVRIYSEPGQGTTVRLYLPREKGDVVSVSASRRERERCQGSESILVVEDDELVRQHTLNCLSILGYKAAGCEDGKAALDLLDAGKRFDLLLTDVVLPGGMSGRQVADAVVARSPGIGVLYMSGYTENAIVHHGKLDRGVFLLGKPFRLADLGRKVREVLDRQEE